MQYLPPHCKGAVSGCQALQGGVVLSALQGGYWGVLNGCLLAQVIRGHSEILVSVNFRSLLESEGFFSQLI